MEFYLNCDLDGNSILILHILVSATETMQPTIPTSESKSNLKESATTAQPAPTASSGPQAAHTQAPTNHLEIPSSNNPNLLSPDILSQRRGMFFNKLNTYLRPTLFFISKRITEI